MVLHSPGRQSEFTAQVIATDRFAFRDVAPGLLQIGESGSRLIHSRSPIVGL